MSAIEKKIIETEYWECSRCDISSETKDRLCPCPRGGCDAKVVGTTKITKEITINN